MMPAVIVLILIAIAIVINKIVLAKRGVNLWEYIQSLLSSKKDNFLSGGFPFRMRQQQQQRPANPPVNTNRSQFPANQPVRGIHTLTEQQGSQAPVPAPAQPVVQITQNQWPNDSFAPLWQQELRQQPPVQRQPVQQIQQVQPRGAQWAHPFPNPARSQQGIYVPPPQPLPVNQQQQNANAIVNVQNPGQNNILQPALPNAPQGHFRAQPFVSGQQTGDQSMLINLLPPLNQNQRARLANPNVVNNRVNMSPGAIRARPL